MCIGGTMDKEFPPSCDQNPSNLASNIIRNNRVVQGALYGGEDCKPVQIDISRICCRCLQTLNCPCDSFANRYKLNKIQLELDSRSFFDKEIVIFLRDDFSSRPCVIWKTYWDFNLLRNAELSDCGQATKERDCSPGEGRETCFPNTLQSWSHIVPDTYFLHLPLCEIRLLKVLDNSTNAFYSLQCLISPDLSKRE